MEEKICQLEQSILEIKSRNESVELNKTWETSWVRRIFIAVGTYAVVSIYLLWLSVSSPFLNALVPPVAYLISTLTLPLVKSFWASRRNKS
ncbi:MAG: hypothetical protein GY804_08090 [Alphaproteobacteria bacterium]|nr:hypothetical protein [Alphaproteobacteria bacterium]